MTFFPISNQLALGMTTNKECEGKLLNCNIAFVEGLNRIALERSERFAFAKSEVIWQKLIN